jgi:hypothetical protein
VCGWLLGMVRDYRYIFIFSGACTALAFAALVCLFLQWRRLGGELGYTPPDTILKPRGECAAPR